VRIAQLANFVGPRSGGMKTALEALGRGYVEAGAERLLVIPGPEDRRTSTPLGDVVEVRAPKVGGGYRLIVEPWRVIDALAEFQPTAVELSDKFTLFPVALWARRQGANSLLISHERLDDQMTMRTGLDTTTKVSIGLLNRILVRTVDTIVVTSDYARAEFQRVADAAGCPVRRVPLGVDLSVFRPSAAPAHDGVLRLVLVGRMSREKSPELAVGTAVELHRRGLDVHLDVYGEGPQLPELIAQTAGSPVTFHGHLSDRQELARRISAADVALSVCPGETFGLAVLEALACGTPVVTADRGGAHELIDAHCGAWAEAHPAALADAVLEVASRPVGVRRAAARQRAELFPWSRTVEELMGIHAGLAEPPTVATA